MAAKIIDEANTNSGFVSYIWSEFNAFFENLPAGETPESFKASMIGFSDDTNQNPDAKLIDHYLYKISIYDDDDQQNEAEQTQFELPLVPQGTHLGDADGDVGLDIVLNRGDYYIDINPVQDPNKFHLNLAFARAAEHILDTAIVVGSTTQDDYKRKLIRESCTQFMDVAAFYGLHCGGQGNLTVTNAGTETSYTEKGDIYNYLKDFQTRDTQYLYIQSNRQRSYDFYGNYKYSSDSPNNIKIGADQNNLAETTFGTLGWPIHKLDNQENIYIQLTTDNYQDAGLYVKLGNIITEHEENFLRNTNLLQQPPEDENSSVDINYTKPIGFNAIVEDTNAITQYIHIIYEGKQLMVSEYVPPPQPGEDIIEPQQYLLKDIDDVFGLITAESFIKTKANVIELPSVIGEELQLINFPNTQQGKDIGVVKTKRIADTIKTNEDENQQRVTYETLLFNIKNTNNSYSRSNSSSIDKASTGTNSFSKQQNNFYQPALPYLIKKQEFTREEQTITSLLLETIDNSFSTKKILGITQIENAHLVNIISDNNLTNAKIYLNNVLDIEEDTFTSIEGINYSVYKLEILAENSQGQKEIYKSTDEIFVYSIDNLIYSSNDYGKYIPDYDVADYSNKQIPEEL